jgi:hypothetical protein
MPGNIEKWNRWRKDVQEPCPVKSGNKELCRMAICPCRRLKLHKAYEEWAEKIEPWAKTGSGRIGGMMRLTRLFGRKAPELDSGK